MGIPMLKIRRPVGRLIFNMGIAIPGKTVFLIETAPRFLQRTHERPHIAHTWGCNMIYPSWVLSLRKLLWCVQYRLILVNDITRPYITIFLKLPNCYSAVSLYSDQCFKNTRNRVATVCLGGRDMQYHSYFKILSMLYINSLRPSYAYIRQ